jgi:methyl-accepting chemotaxis protein
MSTKTYMLLTDGAQVALAAAALACVLAGGPLEPVGIVLLVATAIAVTGFMTVVGRSYVRLVHGLRTGSRLLTVGVEAAHETEASGASAASEQSAAVAETQATIDQLAAAAGSIADNSRSITAAAQQTAETMQQMQETVEAIADRARALGDNSRGIDEIVALIAEISEQTNLLALNAAIEAARAGEAGKGFAVVAAEVRKLAERSLNSSDSIREMVAGIQQQANATILATEHGTRQVHDVSDLMGHTTTMLEDSILATQQQQTAAQQVAAAMNQIRTSADQLDADRAGHGQVDRIGEAIEALERALEGIMTRGSGTGRGGSAVSLGQPALAAR